MNCKRSLIIAIGTLALSVAGLAGRANAGSHHYPLQNARPIIASSGISVNIGIGIPAIPYSYPPDLIVVPGTNVYFVPNVGVSVLFYSGYWWRSHNGYWYRARAYNGPWYHINRHGVPPVFFRLPHNYRHSYSRNPRLNYRDVERHWNRWQNERRWDRRDHYRRDNKKRYDRDNRRDYRRDYKRDRDREPRGYRYH